MDNLRVHHARVVKAWLQDYTEKIELFFLPVYAPELNPDEYLNGDLKTGGVFAPTDSRYRWFHRKGARTHEDIAEVTGQGEKVLQPS